MYKIPNLNKQILVLFTFISLTLLSSCDNSTNAVMSPTKYIETPSTIDRKANFTIKLFNIDFNKYCDSSLTSNNKYLKTISYKVVLGLDTIGSSFTNYDSKYLPLDKFPDTLSLKISAPYRFSSNKIKVILANKSENLILESETIKVLPEAQNLGAFSLNLQNLSMDVQSRSTMSVMNQTIKDTTYFGTEVFKFKYMDTLNYILAIEDTIVAYSNINKTEFNLKIVLNRNEKTANIYYFNRYKKDGGSSPGSDPHASSAGTQGELNFHNFAINKVAYQEDQNNYFYVNLNKSDLINNTNFTYNYHTYSNSYISIGGGKMWQESYNNNYYSKSTAFTINDNTSFELRIGK